MQNLKQIYRATYAGEHVVTNLTYQGNDWTPETEYIANSVFSTYTTTQAIAIGNGESRLPVDLTYIGNHKGGLYGSNKLQSYGCNALYRDFTPDFLVATGDEIIEEIANSGYAADNIVYTNADSIIKYPGKFYLIPQNPYLDSGAIAAYMACFDGHQKVFLLGYDNCVGHQPVQNVYKDTPGYPTADDSHNGRFWELSLAGIIKLYSDVEFVRIMPTKEYDIPLDWGRLPNFRQIDFRDFILEADIG